MKKKELFKKTILTIVVLTFVLTHASIYTEKAVATVQIESEIKFGYNYWPGGYGSEVLFDSNWTEGMKKTINADLTHMASLGARVIRLMIWPQNSGWIITENGGGFFQDKFVELCSNFDELMDIISNYDMEIIIAFGNNYLDLKNEQETPWWKWAYGENGFSDFFVDSYNWVNGIANSVMASENSENILYFDYQNEASSSVEHQWAYINQLFDNISIIPADRRGCSLLSIPVDSNNFSYYTNLGITRHFPYIAFHSYPNHNEDVTQSYNQVKEKFPNSTVLLGEFGCSTQIYTQEEQKDFVENAIQSAIQSNIEYAIHWMFVDQAPNADNQRFGMMEYDSNILNRTPKDVFGYIAEEFGILMNPYFETATGNLPDYWDYGSNVPITSFSSVSDSINSLVGQRYIRLRVDNQYSGQAWISSTMFNIEGKNIIHANSHYRSNFENYRMAITFYNENLNVINQLSGPNVQPQWKWNSYLYNLEGEVKWEIPENAKFAILSLVVDVSELGGTQYLDIDLVSAYAR